MASYPRLKRTLKYKRRRPRRIKKKQMRSGHEIDIYIYIYIYINIYKSYLNVSAASTKRDGVHDGHMSKEKETTVSW